MSDAPSTSPVGTRLAGQLVAVSVSETEDLAQMGLPAQQLDDGLRALLVPLVSEGARIAYGGRVEHEHNFTLVMSQQLGEAYRRMEQSPGSRPFVHFVALHRFMATTPQLMFRHLQLLAPYGELRVTGPSGVMGTFVAASQDSQAVAACAGNGLDSHAALETANGVDGMVSLPLFATLAAMAKPDRDSSFTAMRDQMASQCDARVQLGGRKSGFAGKISGLCEEALSTIAARKPLFVLGGFGGASRDIAIALGLLSDSQRVPRVAMDDEDRYAEGLRRLRGVREAFESAVKGPDEMSAIRELARSESLVDSSELLIGLLSRRQSGRLS